MSCRAAFAGILIGTLACSRAPRPPVPPAAPSPPPILGLDDRPDSRPDAAFVEVVRKECAACHVLPAPGDVPRALWKQRLQDMKRFSLVGIGLAPGTLSALATLDLEPFVGYFEARAPETLPSPEPWPASEAPSTCTSWATPVSPGSSSREA